MHVSGVIFVPNFQRVPIWKDFNFSSKPDKRSYLEFSGWFVDREKTWDSLDDNLWWVWKNNYLKVTPIQSFCDMQIKKRGLGEHKQDLIKETAVNIYKKK